RVGPRLAEKIRGEALSRPKDKDALHAGAEWLSQHDAFRDLPWRLGKDCRIDDKRTQQLSEQSRALRLQMAEVSKPADGAIDGLDLGPRFYALRNTLLKRMRVPLADAVPVLVQVLGGEEAAVRLILVELLTQAEGSESADALARIALF